MTSFAIIVRIRLAPGAAEAFRPLLEENARRSLGDEPGCRRFDVLSGLDGAAPEAVTLYEIYDDEAAFEAHLQTPHYARFKAATAALVETLDIDRFAVWEAR